MFRKSFLFAVFVCLSGLISSANAMDKYSWSGEQFCFKDSQNSTKFFIPSPSPHPMPETDGKLTLRYRTLAGSSAWPWTVSIETSPGKFEAIATTMRTNENNFHEEAFMISAKRIKDAIKNNMFLRFRVYDPSPTGTDLYGKNCIEMKLDYNDPGLFDCPEGEKLVGGKCRAPHGNFAFSSSAGACNATSYKSVIIPYAPPAVSDGVLKVNYFGCEGATISAQVKVGDRGFEDLGSDSTGESCSAQRTQFSVPQVYLMLGNENDRIEFRFRVLDRCQPGRGCAGMSDECFSNIALEYEY